MLTLLTQKEIRAFYWEKVLGCTVAVSHVVLALADFTFLGSLFLSSA